MIYFTMKKGSRLGNWLFQYAFAASLSTDGKVGCFLEDGNAQDPITRHPLFKDVYFVTQKPKGIEYVETVFQYEPPLVRCDGDFILNGYFQSPKYFSRSVALSLFRADATIRESLKNKYAQAFACRDLTSISVRRGDYLQYPHQFPFVGTRYLADAIGRFPVGSNFLVCSDDIPWCREFFTVRRFPGMRFYFSIEKDGMSDMYLVSFCQNNILANSSLSWWGGFLNENPTKRTLAPSRWLGLDYVRKGMNWRDLYYEGTEVLYNDYTTIEYVSAWLRGCVYQDALRPYFFSPVYQWIKRVAK